MDCTKFLELLSDYRDGALDQAMRALVQAHLLACLPCDGIFQDLDSIVNAAVIMRSEIHDISFPDENIIWQRLNLIKQIIH